MPHSTTLVGDTDIDDLLVPVITRLWDEGYPTSYSCQGAPTGNIAAGRGYISGPLSSDADVPKLIRVLTECGLQRLTVEVTGREWRADFLALDGTPLAPHVFVAGHWRSLDLENGTFETIG